MHFFTLLAQNKSTRWQEFNEKLCFVWRDSSSLVTFPQQKEVKMMNNSIKQNAKEGLNNLKYEVAKEIGVNLKNGYNGDLTSKEAGYIGGNMVKKLIEKGEQSL